MNRGHGSVPLRFVKNVVVRMGTQQQQHYEIICYAKISTLLSILHEIMYHNALNTSHNYILSVSHKPSAGPRSAIGRAPDS